MRLKMIYGKKIVIIILILLVLGLHFPPLISAKQGLFVTQPAATTGITKHSPELLALLEVEIPVKEIAKKKKKTWHWVLGGALVVGIIAATAGGGGGDGEDNTGDVKVNW